MTPEEELDALRLRVVRLETMVNTLLADLAAHRARLDLIETAVHLGVRRLDSER